MFFKDYKLGFALCGGGAKGFAHLGAFKAFREHELKPNIIAGTSAGALAGVFLADGFEPEEVAELFKGHKLTDFASLSLFSGGLLKPNGVAEMMKKNLRAKTFEELQIPFIAVATDWEMPEIKCFREGKDLVDAVVASCTVPMVFQPIEINGRKYVDGGVLKNFPVSVIREEAEYIIGVNLSKVMPYQPTTNIMKAAERYFDIASKENVRQDIPLADILIDMDGLHDFSMFDLNSIDTIMTIGYERAIETLNDPKYKRILRRIK